MKAKNERAFPSSLLMSCFSVQVQNGQASVEADRKHILNSIAGVADLNADPLTAHAMYELVNKTVRAQAAMSATRRAFEAGLKGGFAQSVLRSLQSSALEEFDQVKHFSSCRLRTCAGKFSFDLHRISTGVKKQWKKT